jgi:hypothetical protein
LRYNLFQVVSKDQILSIFLHAPSTDHAETEEPKEFDSFSVEDIINQEIWSTELPVDQKYVRKPIVNLQEQGLEPVQHPK